MNILEKIIQHKKSEIVGLEKKHEKISPEKSGKNFYTFLQNPPREWPKLIAEIKKCSPSKGDIFPTADIEVIAQAYEQNGASAISCLTDHHFFGGHVGDLDQVSKAVGIPVLRKDFFLEKSQIKEARIFGADAVLLMVSVLKKAEPIRELRRYAESLGMHCLVETHDEAEIEVAVSSGARIIGVNSRDFLDLSINLENFQKLLPLIPDGIVRVAESGLEDLVEVEKVAHICDAILVGTNFMKTQHYTEMGKLVKQFSRT